MNQKSMEMKQRLRAHKAEATAAAKVGSAKRATRDEVFMGKALRLKAAYARVFSDEEVDVTGDSSFFPVGFGWSGFIYLIFCSFWKNLRRKDLIGSWEVKLHPKS